MAAKSRNAKKPKLAVHQQGPSAPVDPNNEVPAPDKHKMSFAQHQHELQVERTPTAMPVQDVAGQHLKADAQQHQQKPGAHK